MVEPRDDHDDGAAGRDPSFVRLLQHGVDVGIAGVLLLAPLAMGGRYPLGRLVLVLLVAITAVSWCLARTLSRQQTSWFWSGAEWIGGLAVLLVVLQLTPLSPAWRDCFSPQVAQLLPLWSQPADPSSGETLANWSSWNRITLAPQATRGGLAMLLTYLMLFGVVSQHVWRKGDIERLLRIVALAGIGMASVGLLQYFAGNGKFLWLYEHPSRDTLTAVKGTFANENHFAHFLALAIGPLIWWLVSVQAQAERAAGAGFQITAQTKSVPKLQIFLGAGLAIMLLAGLLTYSRGGIAMILLASVASTALFAWQGHVGRRAVIAMTTVVLVAAGAVWIHGQDLLVREIETIQSASLDALDQGRSRRKIWQSVVRAIPEFALVGSGVGSHRDVYPTYFSERSSVQYSHAENGYLQILLETGGPGLALLLCGIGLSGYWVVQSMINDRQPKLAMLAVPVAAAWCVSVVHAVADFNWFIPANMAMTLVLLALAARLSYLATSRPETEWSRLVPRWRWAIATVVVVLTSLLGINHYWGPAHGAPHWDEYLAWSLATNRFAAKSVGPGRQRRLGLVDRSSPDTIAWMSKQLEQLLAHSPRDARAHVRMAAMYLRQFEQRQAASENAMTLAQIRDAALAANFSTKQEMNQWVTKAVGRNRGLLDRVLFHARRGVRLGPLQGRGYLYLAEVAFLDPSLHVTSYELLRQAHVVRPFDPSVQFAFGRQKLLRGDVPGAMALWKEAFRRGPSVRQRVIAAVGAQATPRELIEVFQPDLHGLRDMFEYYRRQERPRQLQEIGLEYVTQLEKQANLLTGQSAAQLWHDAQFAHWVLGNKQKAAEAAVHCVTQQPNVYQYHYACALRLRDADRLQEAMAEFRWCQSRQPQNSALQQAIVALERDLRRNQASRPPAPRR